MSIDVGDVTRRAYLSGVSATTWQSMVTAAFGRLGPQADMTVIWDGVLTAVLDLLASFPSDPVLLAYLREALLTGIVPLYYAVSTFLAQTAPLQTAGSLEPVCRLLLDMHYGSGAPPFGSVVSYGAATLTVLGTVSQALQLLKNTPSPGVGELLVLILSCVGDLSSIPHAQAAVLYADGGELLRDMRLQPDVRTALEAFMVSLNLLLGDGAKAAREIQLMQAMLAPPRQDAAGTGTSSDIVTCSLFLRHLMAKRASDVSFGSDEAAVAMLRAAYHFTSVPLASFYSQMLIAAASIVAQVAGNFGNSGTSLALWKALIVGRLPSLFRKFEDVIAGEVPQETDLSGAMQTALRDLFGRDDLLRKCDPPAEVHGGLPALFPDDYPGKPPSFAQALLSSLVTEHFADAAFGVQFGRDEVARQHGRLSTEAQEHNMDIEVYIETKLTLDGPVQDGVSFLDRVLTDYSAHQTFSSAVRKRFLAILNVQDVEPLSHMCRVLSHHEATLDVISLHVPISELVARGLVFVQEFNCETVGDPQTAVSQFGDVVLFLQSLLTKFQLRSSSFVIDDHHVPATFLLSTSRVYLLSELSAPDLTAFVNWAKAIFDRESEGIDDNILRSTNPMTLLRIAPTLFSEAIAAAFAKAMDIEALRNGTQYFTGPLLNWTLVGVIKAIASEVERSGFLAPFHLDVLKAITTAKTIPPTVLRLCGHSLLRLVFDPKAQLVSNSGLIDIKLVKQISTKALGLTREGLPAGELPSPGCHWRDYAQQAVREALAIARAGGAPSVDIQRCLVSVGPSVFLDLLWTELSSAASLGELETCRRVAAHVLVFSALVYPPEPSPPLLPLFLHIFVAGLIPSIEAQMLADQNSSLELLSAIISTSLIGAFHFERAARSMVSANTRTARAAVDYASRLQATAMALRLARDLRAASESSSTAMLLYQRLTASASICALFPELAAPS